MSGAAGLIGGKRRGISRVVRPAKPIAKRGKVCRRVKAAPLIRMHVGQAARQMWHNVKDRMGHCVRFLVRGARHGGRAGLRQARRTVKMWPLVCTDPPNLSSECGTE